MLKSCFHQKFPEMVCAGWSLSIMHIKVWALIKVLEIKIYPRKIISNGEKCGWLKQMQLADEKHDSNR